MLCFDSSTVEKPDGSITDQSGLPKLLNCCIVVVALDQLPEAVMYGTLWNNMAQSIAINAK